MIVWNPEIEEKFLALLTVVSTIGIDLGKKFQSNCGNYGNEVNYKYSNCKKMRNIKKIVWKFDNKIENLSSGTWYLMWQINVSHQCRDFFYTDKL